ncbi:hypothetical protein [Corallococcus sp. CA047B]|uniref:hypothetical protein n=1 Tax=Corallococcus sp. CA047B TaxID=2316729 RepID=UPI0013152DB3|nr:hypothetical protein [Corallococcus sp. CA047B]
MLSRDDNAEEGLREEGESPHVHGLDRAARTLRRRKSGGASRSEATKDFSYVRNPADAALAGWLDGWMAGWLDGWMAGWLDGWMAGWLDGWMAGWLDGWMAGWLDGWMAGWLDGW